MNLETMLYICEIVGNLNTIVGFVILINTIIFLILLMIYFGSTIDATQCVKNTTIKAIKKSLFVFVISGVMWIFIPSEPVLKKIFMTNLIKNNKVVMTAIDYGSDYLLDLMKDVK